MEGDLRSPAEEAELTRLLREWDRITARIEELGVRMPRRPGAITMREWSASPATTKGEGGPAPTETIQVVMLVGIQDRLRRWLNPQGLELFKIPGPLDDLPTYGIRARD